MKKAIMREIIIIILLSLVIVLTIRMVIFDFIPSEKSLPEAIEYSTESTVRDVLREIRINNMNEESQEILKTYIIEKSDLKGYVSKNKKTDPFTDYEEKSKSTNNR